MSLLNCPFCGEGAELNDYTKAPVGAWVLVHKPKGRCVLRLVESFHSEEAAITAWNTRAPAATASPAIQSDREREAISPASTEGVESRAALIDGIWDEAVDLLVVTGLGHLVGTSGASALIEGFADAVLLYQKGGER